jgi:hypothetical protein
MGNPDDFIDYENEKVIEYVYGPIYRNDCLTLELPFIFSSYRTQHFIEKDSIKFVFSKSDMRLLNIKYNL